MSHFSLPLQSDSELDNSAELNSEVFSSLPRSFKLNRSRLSDEFCEGRMPRRESYCFPSSRLDETSNLVRMRANPSLGSSEPSLSGSCVSKTMVTLTFFFCILAQVMGFFSNFVGSLCHLGEELAVIKIKMPNFSVWKLIFCIWLSIVFLGRNIPFVAQFTTIKS